MRQPRCAETVETKDSSGMRQFVGCSQLAPCDIHPGGAIDTTPEAYEQWKSEQKTCSARYNPPPSFNQWKVCLEPSGHQPPHQSKDGTQWD